MADPPPELARRQVELARRQGPKVPAVGHWAELVWIVFVGGEWWEEKDGI